MKRFSEIEIGPKTVLHLKVTIGALGTAISILIAGAGYVHRFLTTQLKDIREINVSATNAIARFEKIQRAGWMAQDQQTWTDEARRANPHVTWPEVNEILRRRLADAEAMKVETHVASH